MHSAMAGRPAAGADTLRGWLFEHALPLWWDVGRDPRGGFYEKIDLDGRPVDLPQRARIVTRQVFAYCEAGKLGWRGPWEAAVRHGLDQLTGRFLSEDATVVAAVDMRNGSVDASFGLYNQAFALLALASAHAAFPDEPEWRQHAVQLRTTLLRDFAHPQGGFFEDRARALEPLCSNPHMHLLEATLAWAEMDPDAGWRELADGIVMLCLNRFVEPSAGVVREFFTLDWSPVAGEAGRIVEPGHQYEWAFLLHRWAGLRNRSLPDAAWRLIDFADAHGVDPVRGVSVNSLLVDGQMHDPAARLWPQTERLRAYAALRPDEKLDDVVDGLRRYLATPISGSWFDRMKPDGSFVQEAAPASSLYHVVGAVSALHRFTANVEA